MGKIKDIAVFVLMFYAASIIVPLPCKAIGEVPAMDNDKVDYTLSYSRVGWFGGEGEGISNPKPEEEFYMTIYANYEHKSLEHLKIRKLDSFEIISSQTKGWPIMLGLMGKRWNQVFRLKAPKVEGTYKCIFEGESEAMEPFFFSQDIKVGEKQLTTTEMANKQLAESPVGMVLGVMATVAAISLLVLLVSLAVKK